MCTCLSWRIGLLGSAIRIFFPFIFFIGLFCAAQESGQSSSVVLVVQADDHIKQIAQLIKKPIVLESLTYHSDIRLELQEFLHLVDMHEGTIINSDVVKNAVSRLFEKNKFERIVLEVIDEGLGKKLHFKLFGFWTLAKLKLHGIVIGKDKYRQYYLMEPGDPFDQEKHQRSLERIRQAFKNEGYFDGTASDLLEREVATKSVTVHLSLSRGSRYRIGRILISRTREFGQGDEEFDELERIRSRLRKRLAGKSYSRELINKEIEELKRSLFRRGFLQVYIKLSEKIKRAKRTVELSFSFDFLQKRQFVFFGNSFFSNAQLLDVLLAFGDSVRLVPASILAEEIERKYHEKGFWSARVDSREEKRRDFFLIKEGVRASIREIELKGVHSFETKKLVRHCFKALLRKRFFDQDVLKECLHKLVSFYQSRGFWAMQVLNQEMVKLVKPDGAYKLQLVIEEGDRTMVRSVEVPDFPEFLLHRPFARFANGADNCFNPQYLEQQRSCLKKQLRAKGYAHAEVRADLERDKNDVTVRWHISKGDPAPLFGKTVMLGSCTLPFDIVSRSLCYQEGQAWDDSKLKMSVERLRKLGVFEQVHLYPAKKGVCGEQKDLLLKLHKDDPLELRFRAGFGLQRVDRHFSFDRGITYKLGGTFFVKNPLNAGDCFAVDADFVRARRHLNVEYSRPYLFGLPALIKCKGYLSRYEQPGFVGSKNDLYEVVQQGFLIGAREKRRYFDVGLNIGIEWVETRIKNGMKKFALQVSRAINFRSELLGQKIPYFFIEPVLVVDRLEDKANPVYGTFTLLTLKGMFSLSSRWQCATFMKVMGEHSMFHSIGSFFTGALHVRVGHIFFQAFKSIMPFERFYLGGAHSIRAYEADLSPPISRFKDKGDNCFIVPQGGKTVVQVNAELRFPIWNDIGGVVFQDIGTLIGQPTRKFDFSSLLTATGFGLRYNTPIGSLRFDIGWKWHKNHPSEHSYAWFLALGQAF